MKFLKLFFDRWKNNLVNLSKNEPISKISLIVIIVLDIFIFTVIVDGLKKHQQQLSRPSEKVTYECRSAILERGWRETNMIDKLDSYMRSLRYNTSHYDKISQQRHLNKLKKMHPVCRDFHKSIVQLTKSKDLVALFEKRHDAKNIKQDHSYRHSENKGVYDTGLLEDVSGKPNSDVTDSEFSDQMRKTSKGFVSQESKILKFEQKIRNHEKVKELANFIQKKSSSKEVTKELKSFLKEDSFWFSIKKLLWQMLFLLPLFAIFYLWHRRSRMKERSLQSFISAHLLVVTSIPIFVRIIDLVLSIIPKTFFRKVFALLESLKLVVLWHYFLIFGSIAATLFAIYIIQTKIFNKQRLELLRYLKGLCYKCSKKIPVGAQACASCGEAQYQNCTHCGQPSSVAAIFCIQCGEKS